MIGIDVLNTNQTKPKHPWLCPKCRFFKQIRLFNYDTKKEKIHDIYLSCSTIKEQEYIIVHSDEPGDYSSSVTLNILLSTYCSYK